MLSWFRKKEPENYEEVLAALASEISARQARLADIRQRERRATLWFTLYASAAWGVYIALWYARLVPQASSRHALQRVIAGAPVLTGPLVILFARRIMQAWYTRIGNAEEKTLKALSVKQRTKIEEIKKATNYYTTKHLLERYDDSPARPGAAKDSPKTANFPGAIPGTPQRPPQQQQQIQTTPARPGLQQNLQQQSNLLSPVQQPIAPPRRQWYDRLADALLGDDDAAPAASKYALICGRCFAHNGLVHEADWGRTRYACPKCGFFNEAPGAKNAHTSAPTPGHSQRHAQLPLQTPMRRSPLSRESDEDAVDESVLVEDDEGEEGVGEERVEEGSSRMDVDL